MRKNLFLIFLLIVLSGCDKQAELNEVVSGYMSLQSRIIYQPNAVRYRVEFQGKDISTTYYNRDETEGELKVYPTDSDTPELTTQYNITERGTTIQLIKLPGKSIELYNESDYITFSATLALFENYKVFFNEQEIMPGMNYFKNNDLAGTLEFMKEGEADPLSTIEDFTAKAGDNLILLQSSATDFIWLTGGSDEEPAPEADNISKVRFFYAPVGKLNVDAIRLDFIAYDADFVSDIIMDYKSVVVKKGELSPYVELDVSIHKDNFNSRTAFAYSIYNAETGELLEDVWNGNNMFGLPQPSSGAAGRYKTTYKFITYQITNRIGFPPDVVEGLSEKWETETPAE
jgi:hypothetical protein